MSPSPESCFETLNHWWKEILSNPIISIYQLTLVETRTPGTWKKERKENQNYLKEKDGISKGFTFSYD